jgi:hypothetical protein
MAVPRKSECTHDLRRGCFAAHVPLRNGDASAATGILERLLRLPLALVCRDCGLRFSRPEILEDHWRGHGADA